MWPVVGGWSQKHELNHEESTVPSQKCRETTASAAPKVLPTAELESKGTSTLYLLPCHVLTTTTAQKSSAQHCRVPVAAMPVSFLTPLGVLLVQISGLRPGRLHSFRVRAQNAQGQGPWSSPLQASTSADTPGPPSRPVCSKRTSNGVAVKWEAPEQENGASVISYRFVQIIPLPVWVYLAVGIGCWLSGFDTTGRRVVTC